ncbi:uncharacterized protein FMAN_03497 [Fusarium mangiferae]|uniref:Mating factor alpha n=1 Tax=Fusarium mangiferae TaxID=192010 RepID=A0A1L7TDZ8_FUSMA|nr:uncharacterized protein FMAN_03497 [Fusarium mangiferae]CVK94363.1 uncharacterized protein FMAN_03497 [Fusarium mangiferae]
MRFFSVLSTMTLVASVMGAAIPVPVEESNIEVKRAEGHEDAGLQKRRRIRRWVCSQEELLIAFPYFH